MVGAQRDYPPIARRTAPCSRVRCAAAEGAPSTHQRMLVEAIKRARNIALLPFATD